jgi:hypothetical protein
MYDLVICFSPGVILGVLDCKCGVLYHEARWNESTNLSVVLFPKAFCLVDINKCNCRLDILLALQS